MLRQPETPSVHAYFEGVTPDDARSLFSVLEDRPLPPDRARRLARMGWIDPCEDGYLLTWAGRCILETANIPN